MLQYIKSNECFKAEYVIDPDKFEIIKSKLIEIFLKIQEELMTNYDKFLDEKFPEDESDQDPIELK